MSAYTDEFVMAAGHTIAELRRTAGARGAEAGDYPSAVLEALLEHVGDLDLAADALVIRPPWLTELERDISAALDEPV